MRFTRDGRCDGEGGLFLGTWEGIRLCGEDEAGEGLEKIDVSDLSHEKNKKKHV